MPILICSCCLRPCWERCSSKTPFGRKVYAVGGNGSGSYVFRHPARAGGVHLLPVVGAFCVATAGLIQASRSLGSQNTVGQGLELEVLAAVILGGASLMGGSGTIFKTVIGVLILGFIQNGLLLVGSAILRPVRRDLGHHHPCGLAGYRGQARQALVTDRVRGEKDACKPAP